jgi:two-component system sensor histidine kinase RpfC
MASLVTTLRQRLTSRSDSEHIQPILRAAAGIAAAIYALSSAPNDNLGYGFSKMTQVWICLLGGFVTGGLSFFIHILLYPSVNRIRRLTGLFHDMAWCGLALYAFGNNGILIWGMYLWLVIGYGFRYGVNYLYLASATALLSFYIVAYFSPYYRNNYELMALGTFLLALVLPVYLGGVLRSLQRNLETARQADRLKTRFLANVSHDLRTPLHAILANCDALADCVRTNQTGTRSLLDMREAANTLNDLVTDLLDLAKLEAGRVALQPECFNILESVGKVRRLNLAAAQKHDTHIYLSVDPDTPEHVLGDRLAVEQILNNIISNAVKYTDHGHIHIELRPLQTADADGKIRLQFRVQDTGIGMDTDATERIFARFEQANPVYARQYAGAGLGLSIAKELLSLMNGSITVASKKGVGSCFTLSVPMTPLHEASNRNPHVAAPFRLEIVCAEERLSFWQALSSQGVIPPASVHSLPRVEQRSLRNLLIGAEDGCILLDALDLDIEEVSAFADSERFGTAPTFILVNAPGDRISAGDYRAFRSVCATSGVHEINQAIAIAYWSSRHVSSSDVVETEKADSSHALSGTVVLVADDNELNRRVITNMLVAIGVRVVQAKTGREALAALTELQLDAAVLDVQMPDLTGTDVMTAFVTPAQSRTVPLIALTADTTSECTSRCIAAGASLVLHKPVSARRLYQELYSVISADDLSRHEDLQKQDRELDLNLLRELSWSAQEPDYLPKLVDCFERDGDLLLREIRETLHAEDALRCRALLHRFKGMSSSIGAASLADQCGRTLALSDADLICGNSLLDEIASLHKETSMALEHFTRNCHELPPAPSAAPDLAPHFS